MRTKVLVLLTALAIVGMIGPSVAKADQISLGDSCIGSLTVSAGPTVTGSVNTCFGSWEQGGTSTDVSPWSLTNGTDFSIGSGLNTLSGSINWADSLSLGDVTLLVGLLNVGSVTGFNNEFVQGGSYHIDLSLFQGRVSSGEVVVPEPGSLMLFGTGLLSMAGFLRRKLFG
jgi:PEP-CTERM motif